VKPVVDTEIEFGDIATALHRMETRQVFGKIIMRVSN
jgi:alcohol dehydrogenase